MRTISNMMTAAIALIAIGGSSAADAQRFRSASRGVQGAYGRGYTANRSAMRGDGSATVTRGVQTNGGYGASTTRSHAVSDGTYTGGATHSANNGTSWGRTTTSSANGDGTGGSYSSTITGPAGGSTTVSGNVSHTPQ